VVAIVPPLIESKDQFREDVPEVIPVLNNWVRFLLLVIVTVLVGVFYIAWWLSPYDKAGQPLRAETHRQLGLPPCTFYEVSGLPCPSCGMTTSFALLIRGDMVNSLRANWVGTGLGMFCLALIPWALVSVVRRQSLFVRSLDRAFLVVVGLLVTFMTLRWVGVAAMYWWNQAAGQ
jgi:hypothetical protein